MQISTKLLKTDTPEQREASLAEAAEILRRGGLVAFPTETVYGLGADATSPEAVARIFEAKGRPSHNPLIVHVTDLTNAKKYCTHWSDDAEKLAEDFWPGPLTLVVPAAPHLATNALGGGETVGLRAPRHPLALELLRRCALPLAAPSANRSSALSPTTAEAVLESLGGRIDAVLDGGLCEVGIESTVVDLTSDEVCILRPGMIGPSDIEAILKKPVKLQAAAEGKLLKSPGMLTRHYAPRIPLEIVDEPSFAEDTFSIRFGGNEIGDRFATLPAVPEHYAAALYEVLRRAENSGAACIEIARPPATQDWDAINDRLRRAAARED